jgi:hypothetical protein
MATAGDYHLSKAIRTYERDRQRRRKPVRIFSLLDLGSSTHREY